MSDLAESSANGAPLQTILYGGSAVSVALAKRARKAFPMAMLYVNSWTVYLLNGSMIVINRSQAYGLTESNATSVGFSEAYLSFTSNINLLTWVFRRRRLRGKFHTAILVLVNLIRYNFRSKGLKAG